MTVANWLVNQVRSHGRGRPRLAHEIVAEGVRARRFTRRNIDFRDLAQQCWGPSWGSSLERFAATRNQVLETQTAEAFDPAIDSSVFANVTSSIMNTEIEEAYQYATSIVEEITGEYPTPDRLLKLYILDEGSGIEDARTVGEGEEYPQMGMSGTIIGVPKAEKIGLMSTVTLEAMVDGITADRLDMAREVGRKVGRAWARRCLSVVFGLTNTFERNGTNFNTYLTTGAWVNALDDFDQANGPDEYDRYEQLLAKQVNPVTGEELALGGERNVIVPKTNLYRTLRNVHAQELWYQPNGASANQPQVHTPNPLPQIGLGTPMGDPLVRQLLISSGLTAVQADSAMVYGDTRQAFYRRIVRPFQVVERDTEVQSEIGFRQDIVYAAKARIWGVPFVRRPYVVCRGRKMA